MISHDKKFIFIHIPKTGGSSVYKALGGDRTEDPQYGYSKEMKLQRQHLTASELREYQFVSENEFGEYFKFCFVRNPWDLAVSEWKWRLDNFPFLSVSRYVKPTFKEFMRKVPTWRGFTGRGIRRHLKPQYHFIHDQKDNLIVDYVGRFENLSKDFKDICNKVGMSDLELPSINRSKRAKSYKEYYDEETFELVEKHYKIDIDFFGYEF